MKKIVILLALFLITGCFPQNYDKKLKNSIIELAGVKNGENYHEISDSNSTLYHNLKYDYESNEFEILAWDDEKEMEIYVQKATDVYTVYFHSEEVNSWFKVITSEEDLDSLDLGIIKNFIKDPNYSVFLSYESYEKVSDTKYRLKFTDKTFIEQISGVSPDVTELEFDFIFEGDHIKEIHFEFETVDGYFLKSKTIINSTNDYKFSVPDDIKNNAIEVDLTN